MSPGRLGLAILLGPVTWLVCLEADYALVVKIHDGLIFRRRNHRQ